MEASTLTVSQTLVTILFSAFLWAVAVVKIRYAGPYLYVTQMGKFVTLLMSLPVAYLTVFMTESVVGSSQPNRLLVSMIGSGTALVLDGIAYTWYPTLYENEEIKKINPTAAVKLARSGAGFLLYGVGFILLIAVMSS